MKISKGDSRVSPYIRLYTCFFFFITNVKISSFLEFLFHYELTRLETSHLSSIGPYIPSLLILPFNLPCRTRFNVSILSYITPCYPLTYNDLVSYVTLTPFPVPTLLLETPSCLNITVKNFSISKRRNSLFLGVRNPTVHMCLSIL